jgi:hypothetical protein
MREQHAGHRRSEGGWSHRSTPAWLSRTCLISTARVPSRWRIFTAVTVARSSTRCIESRARVIARETGARQEPGRGGGRAFSCARGRSHWPAFPAPRRGVRHKKLPTGCRGPRDRASQLSVSERMGARQHPPRALAAFDRLVPRQIETVVLSPRCSPRWPYRHHGDRRWPDGTACS